MKNKTKWIITVRFPSWGYGEETNTYPAFGVKYLVSVPIELNETDTGIEDYFLKKYDEKIGNGKKFNGEILFIEECGAVVLD